MANDDTRQETAPIPMPAPVLDGIEGFVQVLAPSVEKPTGQDVGPPSGVPREYFRNKFYL